MPRPRNYSRVRRVSDLIQTTLATILQKTVLEPRFGFITITGVTVSPDFSFARVFVSVLKEEYAKEAIKALNDEARGLRHALAQEINLRVTPELKFFYDDSTVRGARISYLINQALKNTSSQE